MSVSQGKLLIEVFPASFGDAILLQCVSDDCSVNILVDGGVRATYREHLATRLQELHLQGEKLDLLVVTHIDADHIEGVLDLLKVNGSAKSPNVIEICDIWHNGYRHLNLSGRAPSEHEKQKVIKQVTNIGFNPAEDDRISVRQADTLASLIMENGYAWNKAFRGEAAVSGKKTSLCPGIDLTLLSPEQSSLEQLAYEWQRGLLSMGISHEAVRCSEFESAFELELPRLVPENEVQETNISASMIDEPPCPSTFVEDTSITNGSSIAFLLECFELRALFLGDSWPNVIAKQWKILSPEKVHDCVDLIKVSHHGSRRNTSPELLERITAKHYVVSTDGSRHDHPNIESLLWIADASAMGSSFICNYPSRAANHIDQQSMKARFGHSVTIGSGEKSMKFILQSEADNGRS